MILVFCFVFEQPVTLYETQIGFRLETFLPQSLNWILSLRLQVCTANAALHYICFFLIEGVLVVLNVSLAIHNLETARSPYASCIFGYRLVPVIYPIPLWLSVIGYKLQVFRRTLILA